MSDGLRAVAAALLVASPALLTSIPEAVFNAEEAPVVDFVKDHYRRYRESPQLETVETETGVRLPRAPENLAFYIDRLYERHTYNQIRDRFGTLREALSSMDVSAATEAVAEMYRDTRATRRQGQEVVTLHEGAQTMLSGLRAARGLGGVSGIESGWPRYDLITGGYQRGDLITMVARPAIGKTYLLLRQAWQAHLAGHSVLFITTEMPTAQIVRRHASIALGVNPTFLRMGTISTRVMRLLQGFYDDLAGNEGFHIFSVGMRSKTDAVEALIQEMMPDFIVIDGLYLLNPVSASRTMSRTDRITAVLDQIKGFTLDYNRPILASTQFNRTAGKGGAEGSLENIGYTDAIGTHSSSVIAARFGPTTNPRHSRTLEFLKGREGETGQIAINFKFAPVSMDEIPPEDLEAAEGSATEATPAATAQVDWMG